MPTHPRVALLALYGKKCVGFMMVKTLTLNRPGFYAENLLLYAPQAKEEGALPLPIGESHKFAPVALGVGFNFPQGILRE